MKAKVKRIKIDKVVETEHHSDSFVDMMRTTSILNFRPMKRLDEIVPEWYVGTTKKGWQFNYHVSWLKDIQELNPFQTLSLLLTLCYSFASIVDGQSRILFNVTHPT